MSQPCPELDSKPVALSQRYKSLFVSQKHADCTFVVGQTTQQCHKLILSTASPVFEAMLYGPMREQNSIEIQDISPDVFEYMLEYIYTGQVDFDKKTLENVIELYYCADKYLLNDLIDECLSAIKSKLSFDNILPALDLSVYMDLQGLKKICLTFFKKCCLNSLQYMAFLKGNYFHVSKNSVKAIIADNNHCKSLVWFVLEWCQNECVHLGLGRSDCDMVIHDLEIDVPLDGRNTQTKLHSNCFNIAERTYYKACRPWKVSENSQSTYVIVQPNRFISLCGVVIHSRLMPYVRTDRMAARYNPQAPVISFDYTESLLIEITAETEGDVIFRHQLEQSETRYNCDFVISWDEEVTLAANLAYRVKLTWKGSSFGAEYPCSLQADEVDGIQFKDMCNQFGSIIKGVKYLNL